MLYDLTDLGLLKIHGADASKLLQGQLTCDLDNLTNDFCLAAHCNPQGRVISLFYLFKFIDSYYLVMPRKMITITMTALKKYAIFYKVELEEVTNNYFILGCVDILLEPLDKKNLQIINIPDNFSRHIIIGKTSLFKEVKEQLTNQASFDALTTWHYLNIRSCIPTIYAETSGKFLPHEINLPQLNAISFTKGCYTGQEIIARMQYRGKLKKHMYATMYKDTFSTKTPFPGDNIYTYQANLTDFQECGIIVDICNKKDKDYYLLIVTEEVHAKNNHLYSMTDHNKNLITLLKE